MTDDTTTRSGTRELMAFVHRDGLRARFFAVPAGAPRDRRPTDITMLIFTLLVLGVFATWASSPLSGFELALSQFVAALPGVLDPLWRIGHDALVVWAVAIGLIALVRHQWGLARDLGVAVVGVICASAVIGRIVDGSWPDLVDGLAGTDGPVVYPAVGLATWVAIVSVASSHLSRPYRYLGRWIVGLGGFATFALGVTTPSGSLGAIALGFAVAAAVHLIFGSPGGLPSLSDVTKALAGIGVDAEPLNVARRSGVVRVRARGADGAELDVKVYGRDAWDGQLLVSLWRFFWYRDGGPTLAVTRLQQVEHEAFLTLLAERRGAAVNPVVAAGADSIGDALLVIERHGSPLAELPAGSGAGLGPAMWAALAAFHRAGISHGSIDTEHVFVDGEVVRFADMSASQAQSSPSAFLIDRAQLLITTAAAFGTEMAIAHALAALGSDGLADVSSYVQPAALSMRLRRDAATAKVDIDDVRAAAVTAAGGDKRDLQRLRRLTLGRVLMTVLLFIAGSTLVSGLLDIGLDTIYEALQQANFAIVVLAFFVSLLSRPVNAYALSALAPTPVPLGRLTMLQFAMNFVNLAMPSTAGRVAVNIRFFQRSGVDPTTSVAIGAVDGFTGFLSQMVLFWGVLLLGLGTLEFQLDQTSSYDKIRTMLMLFVIAGVVAVLAVLIIAPLRRRVLELLVKLREFLVPFLKSPSRLAKTLCANMLGELIYSTTLFIVLTAFDQSVGFPDVVLVAIGVSLFAGLMPVPGGIGVTEAGLTVGFIAMGVPEATAFAAALTVRMVTYYTPPVIGWFAFRWLQRQRYL
jgi:glycosyltransferase 2 family protein